MSSKQIEDNNYVDKVLREEIKSNKTPSVQYVIFNRDSIIHRFKGGYADIKNKVEISEYTTYNAYSVTKTFTALAVLQLAEQGKIIIEKPIKEYFEDFPYSDDITIRQLLNHSAGIPNPIPLSWVHLFEEHKYFDMDKFFELIFDKNYKAKSKPNQKFSYSNLGYVLLGQLIEKISGMTYEDYIRKNILEPLDIKENEMDFVVHRIEEHAKGYHKKYSFSNFILNFMIDKSKLIDRTEGKWNSFKTIYVNGSSYGGLIGNINSFVKYIQDLLQTKCKLLTDEYKEKLFHENFTNDGKSTGMCLSWFKGQLCGSEYYCHAGGGGGYYCEIRIYPKKGLGSVIMFNRTGMSDERFLDKLDKYYIENIS